MKKYLLKEYGSWAVATFSYIAGITGGSYDVNRLIIGALACFLLINSKEALAQWFKASKKEAAPAFFIQALLGAIIIMFILKDGITDFIPYMVLPILYIVFFRFKGEHFLLTEVTGFLSLGLSTLVSYYICNAGINFTLYMVVALFFTAGVFKVRLQLRKGLFEKLTMLGYVAFLVVVYLLTGTSLVIALPLVENIFYALKPYKVKLRYTGWIELSKSLAFLILLKLYS
ncbi:MAG: hypothetical protein GXO97_01040 [Nitrospirae bacterium]|nr:hypothetical protein [Nitrospirota bacterium]